MSYTTIVYGLFLGVLWVTYWALARRDLVLKRFILLLFSLIFYSTLQIGYLPLLLAIALSSFLLGNLLAAHHPHRLAPQQNQRSLTPEAREKIRDIWNRRNLQILWLGIGINVLLLLGFKYLPFGFRVLGDLSGIEGFFPLATWLQNNLLPPLGISFFTFECIAYLVDIYRGTPPAHDLLDFAAYKFFFPKLISGPITRHQTFGQQLKEQQFPRAAVVVDGLWLISCGAMKKALIADRLGIFVDLCFDSVERAGSGDLWLATVAYGLQLFLDFSGYVDMARGSAKLLGFDLPENFDFPYFSPNIADFWRRWHMTLGDWLRNYLYFPLGGSRYGLARTCGNLLVVMVIAGIWHGAAWGFVVWGGLHGLALVVHRLTAHISDRHGWLQWWWASPGGGLMAWACTQLFVFLSWIPFRVPDLNRTALIVQRYWGQWADGQFGEKVYLEGFGLDRPYVVYLVLVIMAAMVGSFLVNRQGQLRLNWPLKLALVPLSLYGVWLFAPEGGLPYIYFDF